MGNIALSCNVRQMKKAVSSFKPVNTEALLIFKPEGLKIWAVDQSNIILLEMFADKSSFLNYSCETERTICLDIEDMSKSLSRVMEDDFLMLNIGEKSNEVRVNIIKREHKKILRNREFSFAILESRTPYKDFAMQHEDNFVITSMLWKTALQDMGVSLADYTGTFLLFISKDRLRFQAGGKGNARTKVEFHKSELRGINIVEESVTLDLSLKYVWDFFRTISDDLLLEFHLKKDKVLICFFEMIDVKLNALDSTQPFKFKLLLAPVLDKDEVDTTSDGEGLEVGSELDVPALDDKKKEEDKGLEI